MLRSVPEVPRRFRPDFAVLPLLRLLARGSDLDRARPAHTAAAATHCAQAASPPIVVLPLAAPPVRARGDGDESSGYVPPTPVPPGPTLPSPTPVRSTVAMLSPLAGIAPRARLVLIARDGGEGPGYPLGETCDLGRTEGNILLGDDRYVSPRHARIQARAGAYYLRDLAKHQRCLHAEIPFSAGAGRRAGGLEQKVQSPASPEQPIVDQDLFLVGQQVLKFEVVKQAEEGFWWCVRERNARLRHSCPHRAMRA